MKRIKRSAHLPKVGDLLGSDWVFHNTTTAAALLILQEGMDCGSFANRPINFSGKAWVAALKSDVAPGNDHQYGEVIATEPTYEGWNEDYTAKVRRTIPAGVLVRVNSRGRVIR